MTLLRRTILSIWSYRLARTALGGLFLWSGTAKLMAPEAFARIVSVYELVPDSLLVPVVYGLPMLEVIAGVGLILDIQYALSMIVAMLLLFLAVLHFGILRGLEVDCGCFSAGELAEQSSLRAAFNRDLLLLLLAGYIHLWRRLSHRHEAPGRPLSISGRLGAIRTKLKSGRI